MIVATPYVAGYQELTKIRHGDTSKNRTQTYADAPTLTYAGEAFLSLTCP